ncbi:helix-turn-helix domain-containing protein [Fontibacillus panacisegetis]|uniref:helix-turn-helix domain-containing protein n=1 Tax=Fontibacillus solani TaxID=1572857 RepID=UPI001C729918
MISIKEAAYSCGFREEQYFMKLFKKYEGMTPLQYKITSLNYNNYLYILPNSR